MTKMMTKAEFERLSPRSRGYAVYMAGANPAQPHIPDESNPYPRGSPEFVAWDGGHVQASVDVLDGEE